MPTPGSLSEHEPDDSASSIYEPPSGEASQTVATTATRRRAAALMGVTGAAVAGGAALVIADLGIPQILGIGRYETLLILIAAGAAIGVTRFRQGLVLTMAGLMIFLLLMGYTSLIREPVRRLIRSDALPSTADAIVVLSAGVTPDGMLPQQGLDRLLKGIELMKAGVAPRIILTRERKRVGDRWVTSDADQARLIALGGGAEVISTGLVASTRDEALRVAHAARRNGWKRIILVTSPFHSRRACATFEKAGLTVSCVPSESRDIAVRTLADPDNRIRAFGMWLYELAGTLRYWQAGWI